MKSGFADPIKIKNQRPKDQPVDGKKSPWDFRCPQYDQRSSNFVNAGTHNGVGYNQPVGTEKHRKSDVIPKGGVKTMRDDEKG